MNKSTDVFDIIDATQEELLKTKKSIRWGTLEDRSAFFQELAKNIAHCATIFRRPGKRSKRGAVESVTQDLKSLRQIYGKEAVDTAIRTYLERQE